MSRIVVSIAEGIPESDPSLQTLRDAGFEPELAGRRFLTGQVDDDETIRALEG